MIVFIAGIIFAFHAGQSYFNPNISFIPNIIIGERTIENEGVKKTEKLYSLESIELAFQSPVDPFSRADVFLHIKDDIEIEEAYLTLLKLPFNLQAKFGKIRPPFGKWNLTHFSEHFTTRHPEFFDEVYMQHDGIAITGGEASILLPLPLYTLFTYNTGLAQVSGSTISSNYNLKTSIGERKNLEIGLTALMDNPQPHKNTYGYNIVFRNRPPGRELYKYTHIQWEHYFIKSDSDEEAFLFFINQQFFRTLHFGVMLDGIRAIDESGEKHTDLNHSINLTYFPSEFARYRIEYGWSKHGGSGVFFQITFSVGPHRPHIY